MKKMATREEYVDMNFEEAAYFQFITVTSKEYMQRSTNLEKNYSQECYRNIHYVKTFAERIQNTMSEKFVTISDWDFITC